MPDNGASPLIVAAQDTDEVAGRQRPELAETTPVVATLRPGSQGGREDAYQEQVASC